MKLLTYRDLNPSYGIRYSRPHISRLVSADKFPRPIKLNGSSGRGTAAYWRVQDIEAWISERARASGLQAA